MNEAGFLVTYISAITGPLAAIIIVGMMLWDRHFKIAPHWHRFGLAFLAVGMIGQTARSWITIYTGTSPRDTELPWWVFKDVGIFVLAASWMILAMMAARKARK